jgi:hypothetical protein
VEIFLRDDVAAAGERGVFRADEHGVDHRLAPRIFRAVDETQEVAVVEVAEAVHFVDRRNRASDPRHDLRRKLEAQVHALGADVEQQVTGRRDRMPLSGANLPEWMQLRRAWWPEQAVPRVGPESHDAGQARFDVAEFNRAQQRGKVSAKGQQGGAIVRARIDRHDQEDRGARERRGYRLRDGTQAARGSGRG